MHLYRRGHGFKSCKGLIFLSTAYYCKALFHIHEMFSYTSISQVFLTQQSLHMIRSRKRYQLCFWTWGSFLGLCQGSRLTIFFGTRPYFYTQVFSPLPHSPTPTLTLTAPRLFPLRLMYHQLPSFSYRCIGKHICNQSLKDWSTQTPNTYLQAGLIKKIKLEIQLIKMVVFAFSQVYEGVAKMGFIPPQVLADHDVILTTYSTLRSDFYHLGSKQGQ